MWKCWCAGVLSLSEKLADAWKVKRKEGHIRRDQRGEDEEEGGQRQRVALVSFFGHKALPSDTCHWVGTNSLSAWQEVKASKQELKGGVYANTNSQRKWVPLVSVCRPDENGTCFSHRHPFRGQQSHKVFIWSPSLDIKALGQLLLWCFHECLFLKPLDTQCPSNREYCHLNWALSWY